MDAKFEPLQPSRKHSQQAANGESSLETLIDLNTGPAQKLEKHISTGLEELSPSQPTFPIRPTSTRNSKLEQTVLEPSYGSTPLKESSSKIEVAKQASLPVDSTKSLNIKDGASSCNVFELVVPYCDIATLLNLARVSSESRIAATKDFVWNPICEKLGIGRDTSSQEVLLSSVSPANILDQGFVQGTLSPYKTFVRAYNELYQYLSPDDSILEDLSLTDKTLVLSNANKLSNVLNCEATANLAGQVLKLKDSILEEIINTPTDKLKAPMEVFHAASIFSENFEDVSIQKGFAETLFRYHEPSHSVGGFFTTRSDESGERRQVSQLKLEGYFQTVASNLLAMRSIINDSESPIPASWKADLWLFALAESLAVIVVFIQDVLETAAKEISELEYLMAVPKIYVAARTLSENSLLLEASDLTDFNLATQMDQSIMEPVLEEFCERQVSYVDRYAQEKVRDWNESVSQRENETEQFLWSSVPRKADKTNFITSLRWAFLSADASEDAADKSSSTLEISKELDVPATELEAQTALLFSKLRGMESLVSLELTIDVLDCCRAAMHRLKTVGKANAKTCEPLFCIYLEIIGKKHIQISFEKAMKVLNEYDPKKYGRVLIPVKGDESDVEKTLAVEPLAVFTELMSIGDIVQQMVHLFFEEELVASHIVRRGDIVAPSVNSKRKFEQMLDDILAEGLSRGIDVMMEQVDFMLLTEQLGSDYCPLPTQMSDVGPTSAASKVIELVRSHLDLLRESTEKTLFDVFQQEVGVRLFTSLTKHLKRQIITTEGATYLIADINAYYAFIVTLRQKNLLPYYQALKQVSQLFLIDTKYAKQIGLAINDSGRYNGLMTTEDLVELVKRRQDWPLIKTKVEKVLYGIFECIIS